MKSRALNTTYRSWSETATKDQIEYVDAVYCMAERKKARGEQLTECCGPEDILRLFPTLESAAFWLGVKSRKRREIRNA